MAIVKLFDDVNVRSKAITVPEGSVCILQATGLGDMQGGGFNAPQLACIRRILLDIKTKTSKSKNVNSCDTTFDADIHAVDTQITQLGDTFVTVNGETWSLCDCNNLGIIAIPGTYVVEFNDPACVGTAQVFAEVIKKDLLPAGLTGLYFM